MEKRNEQRLPLPRPLPLRHFLTAEVSMPGFLHKSAYFKIRNLVEKKHLPPPLEFPE
jgi:hypothetical protein